MILTLLASQLTVFACATQQRDQKDVDRQLLGGTEEGKARFATWVRAVKAAPEKHWIEIKPSLEIAEGKKIEGKKISLKDLAQWHIKDLSQVHYIKEGDLILTPQFHNVDGDESPQVTEVSLVTFDSNTPEQAGGGSTSKPATPQAEATPPQHGGGDLLGVWVKYKVSLKDGTVKKDRTVVLCTSLAKRLFRKRGLEVHADAPGLYWMRREDKEVIVPGPDMIKQLLEPRQDQHKDRALRLLAEMLRDQLVDFIDKHGRAPRMANGSDSRSKMSEAQSGQALTDLKGAWLYRATFKNERKNIHLRSTDFSRAMLNKAQLGGLDLKSVRFTGAQLRNTNLERAVLTDVNLEDADLAEANLTGAILIGSQLKGAVFMGTLLTDARFQTEALSTTTDFKPPPALKPNHMLADAALDSAKDSTREASYSLLKSFVTSDGEEEEGEEEEDDGDDDEEEEEEEEEEGEEGEEEEEEGEEGEGGGGEEGDGGYKDHKHEAHWVESMVILPSLKFEEAVVTQVHVSLPACHVYICLYFVAFVFGPLLLTSAS